MSAAVNVPVLRAGETARSILGERRPAHRGAGRRGAFSAGSCPRGGIQPPTRRSLAARGINACEARSILGRLRRLGRARGGQPADRCDAAAGRACSFWLGVPARAHWGVAAADGSEAERLAAFAVACDAQERRARVAPDPSTADAAPLRRDRAAIGRLRTMGPTAFAHENRPRPSFGRASPAARMRISGRDLPQETRHGR